MIFGSYPCCDSFLSLSMPAKTPVYLPERCPHCGEAVWHRLSRVEPMSWTEEDFEKEYDIDAEAKMVKARPGTDAAKFEELIRMKL